MFAFSCDVNIINIQQKLLQQKLNIISFCKNRCAARLECLKQVLWQLTILNSVCKQLWRKTFDILINTRFLAVLFINSTYMLHMSRLLHIYNYLYFVFEINETKTSICKIHRNDTGKKKKTILVSKNVTETIWTTDIVSVLFSSIRTEDVLCNRRFFIATP